MSSVIPLVARSRCVRRTGCLPPSTTCSYIHTLRHQTQVMTTYINKYIRLIYIAPSWGIKTWLSTFQRDTLLLTWDPAESSSTSVITFRSKHCHKPQNPQQEYSTPQQSQTSYNENVNIHDLSSTWLDKLRWNLVPGVQSTSCSVTFTYMLQAQQYMKYELNNSDSEKSPNHKQCIVWAYDTESTHSEKICQTYVDTYVCAFKPVKNSALLSTTLSPGVFVCTVSRFLQICVTAVV
jgi:hypothetical protein